MDERISRREFMLNIARMGLLVAGGSLLPALPLGRSGGAEAAKPRSIVAVSSSGSVMEKVRKAVDGIGGIGRFVKKGNRVVIKPNAGWARRPDEAANTHPAVMTALMKLCWGAGAKEILIYENPCDSPSFAFRESGIQEAVEKAGGRMYAANRREMYQETLISSGKILRNALVLKGILEADVFINVPKAKTHPASLLTLSLKNLMGVVQDRGFFHMRGLDQCIADLSTRIKPTFTLIDATRILLTHGPKGPGETADPGQIIASTDSVAADSYAATLFGLKGEDISHLRLAAEAGIGQVNLKRIEVLRV